jgi:outer membrane protein OmpA-like peptidoglycan-associated protein
MKRLLISALLLLSSIQGFAQLNGYKWRLGFSAGPTNYLGDIRPLNVNNFQNFTKLYNRYSNYAEQLSFQLSGEYALGNSVGLMFTAGSYQFGAGDRFVQNNGTLFTQSPTFDRALNFQTNLFDAGFSFVIKPDNNWLLSGKSRFAPYMTIGFGVQNFSVSGDLLDANGNRYDYTNPNVIPDGTFETKLRPLLTERDEEYKNTTIYAGLGFGFRVRITNQLEIFAQSDFRRASSDFLDDISGTYKSSYDNDFQAYAAKPGTNVVTPENPYRGFETLKPDWYIYHGMGVKFSLGANKKAFNAPVITQRHTYVPSELSKKQLSGAEKNSNSAPGTAYYTILQLPGQRITKDTLTSTDSLKTTTTTQLMIYPGQEVQVAYDSSTWINGATYATIRMDEKPLTRAEVDLELEKFKSEMLRNQARRDSALMMALADRIAADQKSTTSKTEPLELDTRASEKAAKKAIKDQEKERKKQEKNNELLKDALLVGGTAAATAAITSDKNKTAPPADSLLVLKSIQDSLLIDSLQRTIAAIPDPTPPVPVVKPVPIQQSKVELFFGVNSSELSASELEKLKNTAKILKEWPEGKIQLQGFADHTGAVEYNLKLSERRVNAVMKTLTDQLGIAPDRISQAPGGVILRGKPGVSSAEDRKVEILFLEIKP